MCVQRFDDSLDPAIRIKLTRLAAVFIDGVAEMSTHLEFGNRLRNYFPKIANHCLYHT
jgi:hypothetical protein